MSKTATTIAIATAGGVLAVGVAGAATAAQAAPAAESTSAVAGKSDSAPKSKAATTTSKQAKAARVAALKHQLKTLPGGTKKLPLNNFRISSGWGHSSGPHAGRNHKGQDFAAGTGAPIYSVTNGKVAMARSYYGYGNLVIIKTPSGKRVLYAHQSRIMVKKGQTVRAGQQIGKVGSTGHSTGPHLHFETRTAKDRAFDPIKFLGASKANLQQRANKLSKLR